MSCPEEYSWGMDDKDPMKIVIKKNGERLFSIFVGEAMETAGRKNIMKHVKECDESPWLTKWGADDEIINRLKNEH